MEHIDWLRDERRALAEGYRIVAGIDEAGRGALAGPVVAACVVLPPGHVPLNVDDSKKLSPRGREDCFAAIRSQAISVGVGVVSPAVIDSINILRATHEAMRMALRSLVPPVIPELAFIDGLPVVPFPIPHRAIVHGDAQCACIAAASIVAKVTRDQLMTEMGSLYPDYGFASHKGYGTTEHLRALEQHGVLPVHRRSFRPVSLAEGRKHNHIDQNGQGLLELIVSDSFSTT